MRSTCFIFAFVGICLISSAARGDGATAVGAQPLSLQPVVQANAETPTAFSGPLFMGETSPGVSAHVPPKSEEPFDNDYREVSEFFNIREANPQVVKGEWEFETEFFWNTKSNGDDDEFRMDQTLKYGITNSFFVELEVQEPNVGDGGEQGAGDLGIVLFKRFVKEVKGGDVPAVAGYAEIRLPTGDHSRNTDALLSGVVTKSLEWGMRAHFQAFIETANGGYSDEDDDNRRDLQWGFGPGFDWEIDDKTLVLLNYLNKSGDKDGEHNNNILELGASRQIVDNGKISEHIKAAIDIGLDGQDETPNFGARFLWSISWK